MRVSWTRKISKDNVLEVVGEQRLLRNIRKRQLSYVGHMVKGGLETLCLEGKVEGSRARRRQRTPLLESLATAVGMAELNRIAAFAS